MTNVNNPGYNPDEILYKPIYETGKRILYNCRNPTACMSLGIIHVHYSGMVWTWYNRYESTCNMGLLYCLILFFLLVLVTQVL